MYLFDKVSELQSKLNELRLTYENYISVAIALFNNKGRILVKLRPYDFIASSKLKLNLPNLYVRNLAHIVTSIIRNNVRTANLNIDNNFVEFTDNEKKLRFYGFHLNGFVINQFTHFEYNMLNFKDKIVIDVGANIGDTSIYFALHGARKVYAIEPFPVIFDFLKKNIEFNNMPNVIPLNLGIASKDEYIELPNAEVGLDASFQTLNKVSKERGKKVYVTTLDKLIKDLKLDSIILKMDCEGCEYSLLQLSDQSLDKIDEIMLEYHNGVNEISNFFIKKNIKNMKIISSNDKLGLLYVKLH